MTPRNLRTRATAWCLAVLGASGLAVRSLTTSPAPSPGPETAVGSGLQGPSVDAMEYQGQEVRGVLVDAQSLRIPGVVLELSCEEVLFDRSGAFVGRRPLDVPQPGPTDALGRFAFSVDASVPTRVTLRARVEGLERIEWSWRTDFRGPTVDLGRTRMHAGCTLEARVVDDDGHPLVEGWTVHLESWRDDPDPELRTRTRGSLAVDAGSGTARFEDLPDGRMQVWGTGPAGERTPSQYAFLEPGGTTSPILTESTQPGRDILEVALYSEGCLRMDPRVGTVFAFDAHGEPHALRWDRRSAWTLSPAPSPPYEVVVRDPGFAPLLLPDVWPGVRTLGTLQGRSSVRLDVRESDGRPARDVRLELSLDRGAGTRVVRSRFSSVVELDALDDGWLRGLAPGELEVVVYIPGRPRYTFRGTLRPGAAPTWVLHLQPTGSLEGLVVDSEGRSVPGVLVDLATHARVAESRAGTDPSGMLPGNEVPPRGSDGGLTRFVLTNSEGRFRFSRVAPGTHRVRVVRSRWAHADTTVLVTPGAPTEVTVMAPETGGLLVSPRLPEGLTGKRCTVELRPSGAPSVGGGIQSRELGEESLYRPTGAWVFRHPPAGPLELRIRANDSDRGGLVHFEVVHVEAGQTLERTLDLTGIGFASGEIEVWIGGQPASGVVVSLDPLSVPGDRWEDRFRVYGGWQGPKLLRGVPTGRYRVLVEGSSDGWTWVDPEPLEVVADTRFERRVDVPLVECHLRFVTPDGAAAGPRWVVHGGTVDLRDRHTLATDAEGRAVLRLTPGEQWFLPEVHLPGEVVVTDERLRTGARLVVPESDRPVEFEVVLPPGE